MTQWKSRMIGLWQHSRLSGIYDGTYDWAVLESRQKSHWDRLKQIMSKGKDFPYSLPSVGPGADPGVQAVSPQVTWSESCHIPSSSLPLLSARQVTWSESCHIPSSSLPLLSARPAFTFIAFTRWCYLTVPVNGSTHLIPAYYSFYRPQKDERLSWPSWLTYSGWLTHISGYPSAAGRAQDRESSPARDRCSTTVPRQQPNNVFDVMYIPHAWCKCVCV